jgi:hypothetical protein
MQLFVVVRCFSFLNGSPRFHQIANQMPTFFIRKHGIAAAPKLSLTTK